MKRIKYLFPLLWFVFALLPLSAPEVLAAEYLAGSGLYDITGPPAEVMMMGYVKPSQKSAGIHMRLYARAIEIVDATTQKRIVIVVCDLCHLYQGVRMGVLEKLQLHFGNRFTEDNVLVSAIHTHSGPGGYSFDKLYNLASLGFSRQNYETVVNGIYEAIARADAHLEPATLWYAEGALPGATRNRDPEAYALDPQRERAQFTYDTPQRMSLLRVTSEREPERDIATLSWFAIHGTSLHNTNQLISGDNKGLAAFLVERHHGVDHLGDPRFVAAFANSNAGDATPNTGGDLEHTGTWVCPLIDEFKCLHWSGELQARKAENLAQGAMEALHGAVDTRFHYVDFPHLTVEPEYTQTLESRLTCYAAVGISMLAGTVDGPGIGKQGWNCSTVPLWGKEMCLRDACQGTKPIAVELGKKEPYPWTPQQVPVQVVRIGQLAIAAAPIELTTMSGRRLLGQLASTFEGSFIHHTVIQGYANSYVGYVATPDEYQGQYYEGASTHFGRWTLPGYIQELDKLALALVQGRPVGMGMHPPNLADTVHSTTPPQHPYDAIDRGHGFGEVIEQPQPNYSLGAQVQATFWGANPNNDFYTQGSYLEVQRQSPSGEFYAVAHDCDPETRFHWMNRGRNRSQIEIQWEIPEDTPAGVYRITYRGLQKVSESEYIPFLGSTAAFTVETPEH